MGQESKGVQRRVGVGASAVLLLALACESQAPSSGAGGADAASGGAAAGSGPSSGGGSSGMSGGGGAAGGGSSNAGGAGSNGSTGGASPSGGATASGAASSGGAAGSSGGAAAASGGTSSAGSGCDLGCEIPPQGSCEAPVVRVTEVDVGTAVRIDDSETGFSPLALGAMPGGGSRLAWLGEDDQVGVVSLDCEDRVAGAPFFLPAHDFQDVAADAAGGVVLLTRDARGGGTLNCGNPANLCDGGPQPPIACHEMWLERFDCDGRVEWSTALTTASETLPPYSTGPEGDMALMIWWYQHHGRLAYDGANYAAYFGVAISVSENACINIHQGDSMRVVSATGSVVKHPDDFGDWGVGCSHSWNARLVYDDGAGQFVMVCATDNQGRVARPDPYRTIYEPEDLSTLSVGDVVVADGGGYWLTASDQGQVHLLHFDAGMADQDLVIGQADASHLVAYSQDLMLVSWKSGQQMVAQVRSRSSGEQLGSDLVLPVSDRPYQAFELGADGSVGFASPGGPTTVRIARVLPCQ